MKTHQKRCHAFVGAVFATLLLAVSPVRAEVSWITLPLAGGGTLDAVLGVPEGAEKRPAVIYSHGTFVRRMGYDVAKMKGYDIEDYVEALVAAGYVALAPMRNVHSLSDPSSARPGEVMNQSKRQWIEAIEQGIASVTAGIQFLTAHERVSGPVGLVGFSEGGLVSLWASIEGAEAKALVLMSPATIRDAGPRNQKNAKSRLAAVKAPMLVTAGANDNRSILKSVSMGFDGAGGGRRNKGWLSGRSRMVLSGPPRALGGRPVLPRPAP